jgi:cytochrome c oxidase subunit 2
MIDPHDLRIRSRPTAIVFTGVLVLSLAVLVQLSRAQSATSERVIKITAERYDYSPGHIVLKKGEPVVLELVSEDRLHGFHVKALGVRADVLPGQSVRIRVVPDKTGTFLITCDVFCGSGHGDMNGLITVTE